MGLKEDFQVFISNLEPDNISDMEATVGELAKKLNKSYYGLENDSSSHMYIVGSVGRETAIKGISDLDIIFNLPKETYNQYDKHQNNGQSALLQEVRNVIKERYSKTDISGDGQVVVINFNKYTVELVPGFKQSDDRFKYPDTNGGGSWEYTDPLPEIAESKRTSEDTDNNFKYIANMLRAWKNKQGFKFGGLLIDSLTYKFLNENIEYRNIDFDEYFDMTKALFKFLKDLNKEQTYWYALGSNQQVDNCDNGKFITKARKAYKKIEDLDETVSNVNKKLREIFGSKFPKKQSSDNTSLSQEYSFNKYRDTEQFIENLYPVDIRYNLELECKVTQNGFRDALLSIILKNNTYLPIKKSLEFYIDDTDFDFNSGDYEIYWKVKNEGDIAKNKDCVRGQIIRTNSKRHVEVTSFIGEHFVECYIIQNDVCVAKSHIDVPISNYQHFIG